MTKPVGEYMNIYSRIYTKGSGLEVKKKKVMLSHPKSADRPTARRHFVVCRGINVAWIWRKQQKAQKQLGASQKNFKCEDEKYPFQLLL